MILALSLSLWLPDTHTNTHTRIMKVKSQREGWHVDHQCFVGNFPSVETSVPSCAVACALCFIRRLTDQSSSQFSVKRNAGMNDLSASLKIPQN